MLPATGSDHIGHRYVPWIGGQPVDEFTVEQQRGPRRDLVTAALVEGAHAAGLRVVPWTVNDPDEMAALIELGVDGLVTDDPALAHAVLSRQRSVAVA